MSNLMQGLSLNGSSGLINTMSLPKIQGMTFGNSNKKGGLGLANMTKSGALNSAVGALSGIAGNLISDGYSNNAGTLMQGLGSAMSMIPGPIGMIGGAAGAVLGGLTNRAFGAKMNQENINAVNNTIDNINNFQSNASTFDYLVDNASNLKLGSNFDNSFIGKDGWFSSKAKKKANALRTKLNAANQYAMSNIENNLDNLQTEQIGNLMANYNAFGGPLGFDFPLISGALDYELANKKMALDELKIANRGNSILAGGGPLFTHGSNWTNGLKFIDNGGTHEENPYEGVLMGMSEDGTPNLVEEGEVIWNDYVFSNRIPVPDAIRQKYKLRGPKEMTFADAVKKAQKESEERPNDPIAKRGLDTLLAGLATEQEAERQRIQEEETMEQNEILFALGGGINIKPSKRGTFTAAAKKHHMGVQEFASKVLANKDKYSPAMVKKANFARNAAKWHSYGGLLGNCFAGLGDQPNILNPYPYDDINTFKYWNKDNSAYDPGYLNFINNQLNNDWINRVMSGTYGNMDRYKSANNFNPTIDQARTLGTDKKNSDWHRAMAAAYDDYLNGINPVTGEQEGFPGPLEAPNNPTPPQTFWGPGVDKTFWEAAAEAGPYGLNTVYGNPAVGGYNNAQPAAFPQYVGKDVNTEGTTVTNEDIEETDGSPKSSNYNNLAWLRYAPALGAGIGVFSDLMGWTNVPNYRNADAILEASKGIRDVNYTPIGDYLRYSPLDREFYINQLNAQSGATRRNILNTSAGNRGNAAAGILAADYNAQTQLGNLARQAEEYNLEQRQKVADFNRATNMFNAEQDLRAQIANNSNQSMRLNAAVRAAALKDAIDERVSAARSLNLTNLFESLGNIGIDAANRADRDRLIEAGIFGTLSQRPQGWSKKRWNSYQDDIKKLNEKYSK